MTGVSQFVTRLDDDLASEIDDLVARGVFESRSAAVREGLTAVVAAQRRIQIGETINEGYRQVPDTDEEMALARAMAKLMISAEPWDAHDDDNPSG